MRYVQQLKCVWVKWATEARMSNRRQVGWGLLGVQHLGECWCKVCVVRVGSGWKGATPVSRCTSYLVLYPIDQWFSTAGNSSLQTDQWAVSGDILTVMTGGCHWHLLGGDWGCCWIYYSDSADAKRILQLQMSVGRPLRNCVGVLVRPRWALSYAIVDHFEIWICKRKLWV